ncbi:MAG: alpha/beta hydrolase [Gammaproteobacteria bacterium]|nr:alpha/beta hydrolase [Gammaproteobacteria bacterium]
MGAFERSVVTLKGIRHRLAGLAAAVLVLAACSPIRVVSQLSPSAHLDRDDGVTYGTHERQRLDVYAPKRAESPTAPAPVVVFFYGGTWQRGNRENYGFVGSFLADQGVVAVIPDYRVYPDIQFPDFVHDGAAAVAWVQRNIHSYGGDPERIVLMGHSAGAHIAALLALDSRYLEQQGVSPEVVEGLIGLAGPYRFSIDSGRLAEIFAPAADNGDSQPINFVRADAPRTLLLHGDGDGVVEADNSRALHQGLCEAGAVAELVVYPGVGHVRVLAALASLLSFTGRSGEDVAAFLSRIFDAQGADVVADNAASC